MTSIEEKNRLVEDEVKRTKINAQQTLTRIQQAISLVNSMMMVYSTITKKDVDMRFMAVISSMITLQTSLMTFASAQAAMGNWAYVPLAASMMSQIATVISFAESERQRTQELLDERQQKLNMELDDF